jgi:hypothetical protein
MGDTKRVRQITDGAIITALYCVLFVISRFTGGGLEYNLFFVLPLPLALYAYKYDYKIGIVPLVSTTLLSIFICISPYYSFIYVLPGLVIGIIFGGLLEKSRLNRTLKILIITALCLVMEVLSGVVLASLLGIEDIFKEVSAMVNWVSDVLSKLNINEVNITLLQGLMQGVVPSILLILALSEGLLIYLLFIVIVQRFKMFSYSPKSPSFSFDSAPKFLSVIYLCLIPCFILGITYFMEENSFIHILCVTSINSFIILSMVYIYFGIKFFIVIIRYINKKWLLILLLFAVLIPPFEMIIIGGGIYDSFTSYSIKIIKKINVNEENSYSRH